MAQRIEHRVRPSARRLGPLEVTLGGRRLGAGLLAEDVVGDLAAPVRVHAGGGGGRELAERLAGKLAHTRRRHPQHARQLIVGLSAPHNELENGSLLSRKLVESGHKQGEG